MDQELAKIADDFMAMEPEDRKAMGHVVRRLADRARPGPMTPQESARLILEAAGETGNARLAAAAEQTVGRA